MADYYAFPLWSGGERGGMLSPDALPLRAPLREDLARWSDDYTQTLLANGCAWPDEQARIDLNTRGRALAVRVADELGPSYEVKFGEC
ncbi:hypothetical protein I7331_08530 [Frankia sp. AgB1.8]|nr:hypothetical protein [Frankia sp. AgB1.8]